MNMSDDMLEAMRDSTITIDAKAIWDKRDDEEEKKIKERLKEALK